MKAAFQSLRRLFRVGLIALSVYLGGMVAMTDLAFAAEDAPAPTAAPSAEPTVAPPPVGAPPLSLTKQASTDSVLPGQTFSYTLHISASQDQTHVEVRDNLDERLDVVSIDTGSGSCTSNGMVVCSVRVGADDPATITIVARARTSVTPGEQIVGQASAQDERSFTAASERVVVRIAAPPSSAPSASNQPRRESRSRGERDATRPKAIQETPTIIPAPREAPAPRAALDVVETPVTPASAATTVPAISDGTSWLDLVITP